MFTFLSAKYVFVVAVFWFYLFVCLFWGKESNWCQGPLKYIGVHMHEQKTCEKGSFFFFFCNRTHARNMLRGLKCHVSGKRGGFVKIYPNYLHSNLFRGPIWDKIPQNSCLGGEFCILTKMCLGVYFKTIVQACVHLHIWVAPWNVRAVCKNKTTHIWVKQKSEMYSFFFF